MAIDRTAKHRKQLIKVHCNCVNVWGAMGTIVFAMESWLETDWRRSCDGDAMESTRKGVANEGVDVETVYTMILSWIWLLFADNCSPNSWFPRIKKLLHTRIDRLIDGHHLLYYLLLYMGCSDGDYRINYDNKSILKSRCGDDGWRDYQFVVGRRWICCFDMTNVYYFVLVIRISRLVWSIANFRSRIMVSYTYFVLIEMVRDSSTFCFLRINVNIY